MFLAKRRVKLETARYYTKAYHEVIDFAKARRLAFPTQQLRDSLLVAMLHHLFFSGDAIFAARTAVYGFAFCLSLNMRDPQELAQARLCLRGFERASPGEQRDPLPWEAALLLMMWLCNRRLGSDILVEHQKLRYHGLEEPTLACLPPGLSPRPSSGPD